MALTIDEIIAGINELAGDDKDKAKDVATAIRERAKPVGQHLINVGSALKKEEAKRDIDALKAANETLTTERDEAVAALGTANSTKPDVAKIEADWKAKHEKKVGELKEQLKAKDDTLRGALKKASVAKLVAQLTNQGVDPDYAKEVLAGKHAGNIEVKDDGTVLIKSPDGLEYDGADEDAKVAALAADARKGVAPKWILTNADSGAGVRSGGQSGTGYDAAKVGEEMGKQEKARATDSNLAFT